MAPTDTAKPPPDAGEAPGKGPHQSDYDQKLGTDRTFGTGSSSPMVPGCPCPDPECILEIDCVCGDPHCSYPWADNVVSLAGWRSR